jgi:hypothetical protein
VQKRKGQSEDSGKSKNLQHVYTFERMIAIVKRRTPGDALTSNDMGILG